MFLGTRSKPIVTGTGLASASVMAWRSVSGFGTSGVGAAGVSEVDVTTYGGDCLTCQEHAPLQAVHSRAKPDTTRSIRGAASAVSVFPHSRNLAVRTSES